MAKCLYLIEYIGIQILGAHKIYSFVGKGQGTHLFSQIEAYGNPNMYALSVSFYFPYEASAYTVSSAEQKVFECAVVPYDGWLHIHEVWMDSYVGGKSWGGIDAFATTIISTCMVL